MKKLLHERLREVQASAGLLLCDLLVKTLGIPREKTDICTNRVPAISEAIADEIEKYYIPRPRFEDGEPIQIGDVFIQKCISEEVELDKIGIALFTKDGLNMVWFPDELVQRPKPKILDADGVEIKVGDTVWRTEDGLKMTVIDVGDEARRQCAEVLTEIDGKSPYHYSGKELTHREPDSLEQVLLDMMEDNRMRGTEYIYRIQAIIERDA